MRQFRFSRLYRGDVRQAILGEVLAWADTYDTELAQAVRAEPELAIRALDIELCSVPARLGQLP